jgi:hypothetical protein
VVRPSKVEVEIIDSKSKRSTDKRSTSERVETDERPNGGRLVIDW